MNIITRRAAAPAFEPIDVVITINSQAELDAVRDSARLDSEQSGTTPLGAVRKIYGVRLHNALEGC